MGTMPDTSPIFCTRCGTSLPAGSPFCTKCGAPQPRSSSPQYSQPGAAPVAQVQYAGFWLRFAALIIDQLILTLLLAPFAWRIVGGIAGMAPMTPGIGPGSNVELDPNSIAPLLSHLGRFFWISVIVKWLYYALMESSSKQATIGKLALGLKVTDLHLHPIDFGRASGRYFGKFLSGFLLLIGYIMAAFTARKQALHDILAGTLVVRE